MPDQIMSTPEVARPRGGQYEIANALGRLNADRPKLGARCLDAVPVARAVRYMLHALDLYATQNGLTPERVAHDVVMGRVELRLYGNRAVVVTP
jgi:hypothetical protein